MARFSDDSSDLPAQPFKRSPKEIRDSLRALFKNAKRNFSQAKRRPEKESAHTRKRAA